MTKCNKGGLVRAGDSMFFQKQLEILSPKETADDDPPPIPTAPEFQNRQLNLFQNFLYNRRRAGEAFKHHRSLG